MQTSYQAISFSSQVLMQVKCIFKRSETDAICRKLHLKDFLPTEVQRLVKYRLLFHELTKNAAGK